ncbi:MAG: hypothetical protein WCF22_09065 [Candidatus Sulfotelmatobacter sp.]
MPAPLTAITGRAGFRAASSSARARGMAGVGAAAGVVGAEVGVTVEVGVTAEAGVTDTVITGVVDSLAVAMRDVGMQDAAMEDRDLRVDAVTPVAQLAADSMVVAGTAAADSTVAEAVDSTAVVDFMVAAVAATAVGADTGKHTS